MVIIRKKIVSEKQAAKVTNGKKNTKKFIVIHETDNTNIGADADAHARLQKNGNTRSASWHWQVDDDEAIQSFEHDWACWAAGTLIGNNQGIQVEICVNRDGNYNKAIQNAATLVAKIMRDESIPIKNVVQHNYFSGKNCPRNLRAGKIEWSKFLQMIVDESAVQPECPVTDQVKYRVVTGTFGTKNAAEKVVEIMKIQFGWIAYVEQEGDRFRIKTGTFTGVAAAQKAEKKIKSAKLAQVTYIIISGN